MDFILMNFIAASQNCKTTYDAAYILYLAFPLWFGLQFFYATTQNLSMASRAGGIGGRGQLPSQILVDIGAKPVLSKDLTLLLPPQNFRPSAVTKGPRLQQSLELSS